MASPLTGPQTTIEAVQDLNDRLTALEQTSVVPVGLVAYCAKAVPNGWLALDGSTFSATRYGQLASYLGGTTLPDVRGRVMVGQAASGTFITLLGTGGAETVTLTGAQSGVAAHTHSIPILTGDYSVVGAAGGGAVVPAGAGTGTPYSATRADTTGASAAANASAGHANLPPYIILIAIIKY